MERLALLDLQDLPESVALQECLVFQALKDIVDSQA